MSLLTGVRSAVCGALKRWGQIPSGNSWYKGMRDLRMTRISLSIGGNRGGIFSLPKKNLGGLMRSMKDISKQTKVPISVARYFGTCTVDIKGKEFDVQDAVSAIRNTGSQISLLDRG